LDNLHTQKTGRCNTIESGSHFG